MEEKESRKAVQFICLRCGKNEFWKTSDNRLKCKKCRYLFTPRENPLKIPEEKLREIISDFLLGHSTNVILERIKISKYKLLKILSVLRILMTKNLVKSFNGKIKIEDEYFEKEIEKVLKNKTENENEKKSKEQIFGIFCDDKKCFAKTLPEIKPRELKFFFKNYANSIIVNWQGQVALAFKDSFYRMTKTNQKVDLLSVFWGYLKNKLSEKGGIRKEKLPFYLGEYSWRFNNRKKNLKEKEEILYKMLLEWFRDKGKEFNQKC